MAFSKAERAFAKLNLTLDVTARRADGYHDLCMVMQTVGLWDTVTLRETGTGAMCIRTDVPYLPEDDKNLAAIAAKAYFEAADLPFPGMEIQIQKRIPVCAGMGGGSSDGAAVLRALNEHYGALSPEALRRVGASVGSDVPYCIWGKTALAEGKGERLRPLPPLPPCFFVICKPRFSVSTPALFSRLRVEKIRCRPDTAGVLDALAFGDLDGVAKRMYNVFEPVLEPKRREELGQIRAVMIDSGALGASMSGTGPTMFGLFRERQKAETAFQLLKKQYDDCFLTRSV
ncbi:MAG: 4-(cytidine 5'-diphospho)-2-C-methyl-D-erythritol kinase [Oscillospiraceae bacterium]|jgi:4-diphosphocytidyl-2-C-methyl-D-erythritol kinase